MLRTLSAKLFYREKGCFGKFILKIASKTFLLHDGSERGCPTAKQQAEKET